MKLGGIVGSEYLRPGQTDPYQWVNNVLLPHLAAKGVTDPAKIQEVIAAIASQTTTAQMMAIFATQQARILRIRRLCMALTVSRRLISFERAIPG